MIAVSYHDTVNVLQGKKLAAPGPFDRDDWFGLLAQYGGKAPLIALARDGVNYAALALMQGGEGFVPLANWYSFSWRPLLSDGADGLKLLTAIARDLKSRTNRISFSPLPDEDASANMLQQAFVAGGWVVFRSQSDSNHVLPVAGRSYAEYIGARPGKVRTTLKRKAKKVEVDISTVFQPDAWKSYEEIYAKSWKPEEGDPDLLRSFAEKEGAAGRLRFGIARHNGDPIAAQFWTVESGTAYIHKLAHLEDAKPLSPGTTLTAALFEQVIDRDGVAMVDFGTGNDGYKADWMEQVRPRFRLECHRPGHIAGWPALAKATLRHLASRGGAG